MCVLTRNRLAPMVLTTPINTTIDGNTFNGASGSTGSAVAVFNNLVGSTFTGVSVGATTDNTYTNITQACKSQAV